MALDKHQIKILTDIRTIFAVRASTQTRTVSVVRNAAANLDRQYALEQRRRKDIEEGWETAVAGQSLQVGAAVLWTAQWQRNASELERLSEDKQTTDIRLEYEITVQASLNAKRDAVDKMRSAAIRRNQRLEDEMCLDAYGAARLSGWRTE